MVLDLNGSALGVAFSSLVATERKRLMIQYLLMKIQEEDWHGVADAAMDLMEIEVELRLRRET